jgi:hypothetical protein
MVRCLALDAFRMAQDVVSGQEFLEIGRGGEEKKSWPKVRSLILGQFRGVIRCTRRPSTLTGGLSPAPPTGEGLFLLVPVDAVVQKNVTDYAPDAIFSAVAAIGNSSRMKCSIRESICSSSKGENFQRRCVFAWMNRHSGIARRSPTISQTASTTATQASMLISSSQGSVAREPQPLCRDLTAQLIPPQALGQMATNGGTSQRNRRQIAQVILRERE